jgi:hypothetical protein
MSASPRRRESVNGREGRLLWVLGFVNEGELRRKTRAAEKGALPQNTE